MTRATPPVEAIILAVAAVAMAVGTWQWRQRALRITKPPSGEESWQHVQARYPIPVAPAESVEIPEALLQGIIKANPFSPERRRAHQPPEESSDAATREPEPIPPKLLYKGHVAMGNKQRAIVEDTNTKKTYFLQVGQEVAGCKVLDISERQVLLSDPQSPEPVALTLTPKGTRAAP